MLHSSCYKLGPRLAASSLTLSPGSLGLIERQRWNGAQHGVEPCTPERRSLDESHGVFIPSSLALVPTKQKPVLS